MKTIMILAILISANGGMLISANSSELVPAKKSAEEAKKVKQAERNECLDKWNRYISDQINNASKEGFCSTIVSMVEGECVTPARIANKVKELRNLGYKVTKYSDEHDGYSNYDVEWCKE